MLVSMSRFTSRALCLSALVSSALLGACEVAQDGVTGAPMGPGTSAAMKGFSWVIDNQVAGMPRPGVRRPLDEDLQFLRDQGIDVLVTLTETTLAPEALSKHGLETMHIPVIDFHAPTQEQLDKYVNAVQG